MSSMYRYCAFQFSEEFSALETSSIAISFLRGSVRSACPETGTGAAELGRTDGFALALALGLADGSVLSAGSGSSWSSSPDATAVGEAGACAAVPWQWPVVAI